MVTPGAVIGDVHALLALAGGFAKRAVHVELGLLELVFCKLGVETKLL
jgi:hypothetical protein